MNHHPFLSACAKFELNWLRNEKVKKELFLNERSGKVRKPKLEMTSYLDNAYDITIFWVVLKSSCLYCIPTKFHCSQTPNGRVNLGAFLPPPPSNIGCRDPVQNRVNPIMPGLFSRSPGLRGGLEAQMPKINVNINQLKWNLTWVNIMAIKAFLIQNLSLVPLVVLQIWRHKISLRKWYDSSNSAIYPRKTGLTLKKN